MCMCTVFYLCIYYDETKFSLEEIQLTLHLVFSSLTRVSAELGCCQSTEGFLATGGGVLTAPLARHIPRPLFRSDIWTPGGRQRYWWHSLFRCVMMQAGN